MDDLIALLFVVIWFSLFLSAGVQLAIKGHPRLAILLFILMFALQVKIGK